MTGDEIYSCLPELETHRSFISSNPRGWGYWVWKPLLIKSYLSKIKDGEALIYFDAGCEILPQNSRQLKKLLNHLVFHDQLLWSYAEYPIFNVAFWSKQNLLDKAGQEFGLTDLIKIPKVWAGNIGLVKSKRNLLLVDDWIRLSTTENYTFLDDSATSVPQVYPYFGHRHDQSILSLLIHAYRIETCGSAFNYCYGEPHVKQCSSLLNKPFLAMRNDSHESQIEPILKSLRIRSPEYLHKLADKLVFHKPRPIMAWSEETAVQLTSKHKDTLIEFGLM